MDNSKKNHYLIVLNALGERLDEETMERLGIEISMPKFVLSVMRKEGKFIVDSVYDNKECKSWDMEQIKKYGLFDTFSSKDDLKEGLNLYLHGDESKFKIKLVSRLADVSAYTCFVYD